MYQSFTVNLSAVNGTAQTSIMSMYSSLSAAKVLSIHHQSLW